jgi:3-dehydroquinate synthase/2-deoxy-scyllo-inosose synthase
MTSFEWRIGSEIIPFHLGSDCAADVASHLKELDADRFFVVADESIWRMHGAAYERALSAIAPTHFMPYNGGEAGKTLPAIEHLAAKLIDAGVSRRSVLIAMGGGVIGNITGLTASLLFRGIRFVQLPTTLLAMHDSVTSLKQGVNCNGGKNILGTFHAPSHVFIDLKFLSTLPQQQIRGGLIELVKNALILGGEYAKEVTQQLAAFRAQGSSHDWTTLVKLGLTAKRNLVQDDPRERGYAMILEYGHTIGHALELAYVGQLSHGEAVAWGMRCAAWIAHRLGYMNDAALAAHDRYLSLLDAPPKPTGPFKLGELRARVQRDNKRGYLPPGEDGMVAMILLREPGVIVNGDQKYPLTLVPRDAVDASLDQLARMWQPAPAAVEATR